MITKKLVPYEGLKCYGIIVSKTTLWRQEKRGLFPKRVRPTAGTVAWIESEIIDFIQKLGADRASETA